MVKKYINPYGKQRFGQETASFPQGPGEMQEVGKKGRRKERRLARHQGWHGEHSAGLV